MTYQTYIEWLQVEPDINLIIPSIKEDISKALLTQPEIDALRSRVLYIKNHGHAKYLENDPVSIVREFFEGSMEVVERQARIK
jgi:hypothetical protein